MKQRIALFGMVAVALIFAACGGDSGNNGTEVEGTSSSSVDKISSSSIGALSSSLAVSSSSEKIVWNYLNPDVNYGEMTDPRDGQTYKTVVIGSQTWMAENLNYTPSNGNSWCYNNLASNCATYGRLYDWNTVMAGSASSATSPSGVQGTCPSGWHVPSDAEWTVLTDYVGPSEMKLKANHSLWTNAGSDDYGFSALPGGRYNGLVFSYGGNDGYWWSATGYHIPLLAYTRNMNGYNGTSVISNIDIKSYGFSLRCLKDSSSSSVVSSSSSTLSSSSVVSSSSVTKDWFNAAISYGSMTDSRDNQVYKTVVIGTQTWMAENLNYDTLNGTGSWCYKNIASICETDGRLYNWYIAMAGSISSKTNPSGVQGICPTGWHVPSNAEWTVLTDYVGGASTAGTKLKANSSLWSTNTGTDDYGFSALPGGGYFGLNFINVGYGGRWWSATDYGVTIACYQSMYDINVRVSSGYDDNTFGFSLRCVKD